jgi:hypothetical protein
MKKDFIPRNEEDFNDWQENWIPKMVAKATAWGIPDLVKDENTEAQDDWAPKYAAGKDEADPTSSQRKAKNDSRKAYIKIIRKTVKQYIANNDVVTNTDKVSLRITVPDTIRTRVSVPDHAPKGTVKKIDHLFQELRIVDPETPTSKAKPEGVARINVYRYIGTTAPVNFSQYSSAGSATTAKFISKFEDEDIGKKAWHIFEYENTRGERGPKSDAVSAAIA